MRWKKKEKYVGIVKEEDVIGKIVVVMIFMKKMNYLIINKEDHHFLLKKVGLSYLQKVENVK